MIITAENNYEGLDRWLVGKKKVLLVCDDSIRFQEAFGRKLADIKTPVVRFSDFQPNPAYESVIKGRKLFLDEKCDSIITVGGGSSMDVAKCIKLYAGMPGDGENGAWLTGEIMLNDIPFLAMPTTAGTGSEATRYAVIYYEGKKQSITSDSIIPDTILMDPDALKTLPVYQRKATMCDALCHAIESFWSVNSTGESREYSRTAIRSIMEHMEGYLANTQIGNAGMLLAAHIAGKAINITQTTAGHAMCYKITSMFGCAHGHAAILCDRILYFRMIQDTTKCSDPRGKEYLDHILQEIGEALGCGEASSGVDKLTQVFDRLELAVPEATGEQFKELAESVNPVRLKNHPIRLDAETINRLYHEILREKNEG